ncbi:MAG: DUF488 family protein, partial [Acidimicrobiales bacterium]
HPLSVLIHTVGHGALTPPELLTVLGQPGVGAVADVRRYPGSRRHPHFARGAMEKWLPDAGVAYRWVEALGGRRRAARASPNVGLRNEQFRGYADHMRSLAFVDAVADLLAFARECPVAVLCAEAPWWNCHRRLLADHLVLVEGVTVEHLLHDGRSAPHAPTPSARLDGGLVVYDAGDQPALFGADTAEGSGAPAP